MDTGIVAALAALAGGLIGKAIDVAVGARKGKRDWYTEQLATLRADLAKQDARIEQLETRIDTQRATIRQHEDTIAAQGHTIAAQTHTIETLRGRVAELESKNGTQQIDLNVTMATPEAGEG